MTVPLIKDATIQIIKEDKTLLELDLKKELGSRPCRK
jgi:hypothetical protein